MSTYESALHWQATRPRPSPTIRQTGRPFMTVLAEALEPTPLLAAAVVPDGACLDCGAPAGRFCIPECPRFAEDPGEGDER